MNGGIILVATIIFVALGCVLGLVDKLVRRG